MLEHLLDEGPLITSVWYSSSSIGASGSVTTANASGTCAVAAPSGRMRVVTPSRAKPPAVERMLNPRRAS